MEKRACGILRSGGCFGRYFCIWRCQNRWEGANDWEDSVERCVDGFYALGMVRFHQYLSFHLDFSVEIAVAGAKNGDFWAEMQGSFYERVVVWCSQANGC